MRQKEDYANFCKTNCPASLRQIPVKAFEINVADVISSAILQKTKNE
jgi:hypothetical protein